MDRCIISHSEPFCNSLCHLALRRLCCRFDPKKHAFACFLLCEGMLSCVTESLRKSYRFHRRAQDFPLRCRCRLRKRSSTGYCQDTPDKCLRHCLNVIPAFCWYDVNIYPKVVSSASFRYGEVTVRNIYGD